MKSRTLLKSLTAVIAGAIVFAVLSASAEKIEPANRIKQDFPSDNMAVWLSTNADTFALNPINIRAGKHPDRDDPEGGPYDVIYIFPDAATANAWWEPIANPAGMPTTIPDTAVAMVHWELDNGSGEFPGIMSKSDIDGFKSKNCIMAAGTTIPLPGDKDGEEKNCNNPQGTSKRFKMNVMKPDVPIDLVYNVEPFDLTYENYDTLPTFDGVEEAGRIYRVLQKWHNTTAMDTENETRDGVRIVGYRLELGHGVGNTDGTNFTKFTRIADDTDAGLSPDKTIGFELRPCLPDHFLDVLRFPTGTGTNPCSDDFDADVIGFPPDGQPLPQEIWLEEEYGAFSPRMYSTIDDKRMLAIGIPGGFWDKRPGGIYPPEIQTLGVLDSGYEASDDDVYWDSRVDGATELPGYIGATTPNYFDMVSVQAADADDVLDIDPGPFGYLMYWGVLSDESYGQFGDFGILSQGIYRDDDGDPTSEGDLIAWWDGDEYRWSIDGEVFDGVVTPEEKFDPVATELLQEWALYPLVEDCGVDCPPGPLFETGVMDDLGGLNIDYFVYLGRSENYDAAANPNFTIRLTAVSTASTDPYGDGRLSTPTGLIADNAYGNSDTPPWVVNEAPALETFISDDGIIDIKALGFAGDPLLITLGDTGATSLAALPTVVVENLRTGEVEENVELTQDPVSMWKFTKEIPTVADALPGTDNDGSMNVWPNDVIQVTYVDADDGTNANVVKTDTVTIPIESVLPDEAVPVFPDDDGGFCSYHPNGRFDPVLPALVLIGLGYLGLRRKTASGK